VVSENIDRYAFREFISRLISDAFGEQCKYSQCGDDWCVLSWEHKSASSGSEQELLEKISTAITGTFPSILEYLDKAAPDLPVMPSIKSEFRIVTAAGLRMRYFDIPPHAREHAFTMKFKTVLLTEADVSHAEIPSAKHKSFAAFSAGCWYLCGKLLLWNPAHRKVETCAAFYSHAGDAGTIANDPNTVVGVEFFVDTLISLLLGE